MRALYLLLALAVPAVADQEPEGRAAFITASLAYHARSWGECVDGYAKTIALHHEVPFSSMMIARCFSMMGDVERGILALEAAAEAEFPNAQLLLTNDEFAALRDHPKFAELVNRVRANARPCPNRFRRRQLDFWIGEWDVTNAAGQKVGTDVIDAVEDGCLLRESFIGPAGGTGKSISFYDRLTGYWRQVWMDPSGLGQDFYGEWTDGSMLLKQVTYNGGLKTILTYAYTAQANGTVRQVARRSVDDGETWTLAGDFTYTRKGQ